MAASSAAAADTSSPHPSLQFGASASSAKRSESLSFQSGGGTHIVPSVLKDQEKPHGSAAL
jgi:hypothetical protein